MSTAATTPKGEALYNSLIDKNSITLKSGCLLTITKIGTNEIEIRIETNINSEAVSGSAMFKKSCPKALPAILTIM